jgi:hypothetical protein
MVPIEGRATCDGEQPVFTNPTGVLPVFNCEEAPSNGDAFSAATPNMDCEIGIPGWPQCRSSS